MRIYDETRTLPKPRPKTTITFPRRLEPMRSEAAVRPPAPGAEAPEADRPDADSPLRKHASAGSGTALAPMSIRALNRTPQEAPAQSTYGATLALLRGRFPAIFGAARPLKIGIHRDIEAALAQEVSKTALRKFLARWTRRDAYLEALAAGVRRVDLNGNDAGPALELNYPEVPSEA